MPIFPGRVLVKSINFFFLFLPRGSCWVTSSLLSSRYVFALSYIYLYSKVMGIVADFFIWQTCTNFPDLHDFLRFFKKPLLTMFQISFFQIAACLMMGPALFFVWNLWQILNFFLEQKPQNVNQFNSHKFVCARLPIQEVIFNGFRFNKSLKFRAKNNSG